MYKCVFPCYSRASLIIHTMDMLNRVRSRENVINWPCQDIARFATEPFRMSLSSRGFVTVLLSKYSIIVVSRDRDRP